MLSKRDFEKELGRGISIYPFKEKNIKENSINFSVSSNAWTLGNGTIIRSKPGYFSLATPESAPSTRIVLSCGDSAIRSIGKRQYLILLPNTTTIVETQEVIGVSNRIGGTLHSKVGIVAQGIGDIGTMLGPCYCGHLMISLHNLTDHLVVLPVGETFVSIVFHYLDTPAAIKKNTNMSGHVDMLSELGIHIDAQTREFLTADWKQTEDGIREKMTGENSFKLFEGKLKKEKAQKYRRFFTRSNILIVVVLLIFITLGAVVAYTIKSKTHNDIWVERYWTIMITGIIVPFIMWLIKQIKPKE